MKLTRILISFLPFLLMSVWCYAQDDADEKLSLENGPISSQFEYLFQKSYKWTDPATGQQYRTIKVNSLFKFRNNVFDSLNLDRKELNEKITLINQQKKTIDSLNTKFLATNEKLNSVTEEKDSIKLLGISMSKAAYNSLLWTIILILGGFLFFFIAKFKSSNAITIEAKKAKAEIEDEYESHRQRALEREQKLRRELQDEINKQKYAKQASDKKNTK